MRNWGNSVSLRPNPRCVILTNSCASFLRGASRAIAGTIRAAASRAMTRTDSPSSVKTRVWAL